MFAELLSYIFLKRSKAEKMTTYTETYQPFMLNKFEYLLKENRGGEGYFVGDNVSILYSTVRMNE